MGTVLAMAIDVNHLREAAQKLGDLTESERAVLALIGEGLASREIAERLKLSESTVYLVIADLLDALEYAPPRASADEIHRRAGTRPASAEEIARFNEQVGPFRIGTNPDGGSSHFLARDIGYRLARQLDDEFRMFADHTREADFAEGVRSFLEKRPPRFGDRAA
jgi:hypothetical protein